jgi:hypothetical protein
MTREQKIEKAHKLAAQILDKNPDMQPEFAQACGAYMVLTGQYRMGQVRFSVWSAGIEGYDKFVAQF